MTSTVEKKNYHGTKHTITFTKMTKLNYTAKKKWDGKITTLKTGFTDMMDANDWINEQIAKGELPPVESETREYFIIPDPLCPRCHKEVVGEHPAISRRDNETEICSECGTEEAIFDYVMSQPAYITMGVDVHTREAMFKNYLKEIHHES